MYTDAAPAITTVEDVLAGVAGVREQTRLLERGLVVLAVEWAKHNPGHPLPADHPGYAGWEEQWLFDQMHHQGTISFADHTVSEFAIAAGLTEYSARKLIRESLMLVHFLPRVWARVLSGGLDVWRARQLAGDCCGLTRETVDFIDRQMSDSSVRITTHTRHRIVGEARKLYMPEEDAREAKEAREARKVEMHEHMTQHGVTSLYAILDHPDALALDLALNIGAQALESAGSDAPLGTRRAWALGDLARAQIRANGPTLDAGREGGAELAPTERPHWDGTGVPAPQTTLFIHMPAEAFAAAAPQAPRAAPGHKPTGTDPVRTPAVSRFQSPGMVGDLPIDAAAIREWFTRHRAFGQDPPVINVRPVVDLSDERSSTGYVPPPRTKEHARLLHDTCVFPFCTRTSMGCDVDHIDPWREGAAGGATCSCNLAPLCRTHHRLKTHGDNASRANGAHNAWSYVHLGGQDYYWRGPRHMEFVTNTWGTFNASAERNDGAPQHPTVPRLGLTEPPQVDLGDDAQSLATEELIDSLLTKVSETRSWHAKEYVPKWKMSNYPDPFVPPDNYPDDAEQQAGRMHFFVDYTPQWGSPVLDFFKNLTAAPEHKGAKRITGKRVAKRHLTRIGS